MNPYTRGRVPGISVRPTLGAWQTRHALISGAYAPPQWLRVLLQGCRAFWWVFPDLTLPSGVTDLTRFVVHQDFFMMAVMATATQAGGTEGSFRLQLIEEREAYRFSTFGLNQNTQLSIATQPGLMRRLHLLRAESAMLCRIQNLTALTNTVSVALFGYQKDVPGARCAAPSDDPTAAALAQLQTTQAKVLNTARLAAAPYLVPPPDAESFHVAAGISLPAVTPATFTTVVEVRVPPGRNGVLNRIANQFVGGGFVDFSGAIVWQIVRNPGPGLQTAERNYEKIIASLGSVANPAAISPIRIFENDVIQIVVNNNAIVVGMQTIGGLLGGYFYPRSYDDQFERDRSANEM
jgi:hypothetical protein